MTACAENRKQGRSATDRAVEVAGELILSIGREDPERASVVLGRISRQKISARVLIVLAVIASGALRNVHGDSWKDHVTDYPEHLNQEEA